MKLKDFVALLKKLLPDKVKEIEEVEKTISDEPPTPPTPKKEPETETIPPALQRFIDSQTEAIKNLSQQVKDLNEKSQSNEKNQLQEKIDTVITKAKADKKIAAKDDVSEKMYRTLLEANFDNAKKVIEVLPVIGEAAATKTNVQTAVSRGTLGATQTELGKKIAEFSGTAQTKTE